MDMIIEILLDCVLSLITDGGVEVMSNSENTRNWPKGVRIALVTATLIIFIAVTGLLFLAGVSMISDGKTAIGTLLLVIASAFVIFPVIRFIKLYRKKRK